MTLTWTDGKEYDVKLEPGPGFVLVSIRPLPPAELEALLRAELRKWIEAFAIAIDHPECILDDAFCIDCAPAWRCPPRYG